ncbi:hypothetical protein ACFWY9_09765 [Amycolatopsis sp. NPDC059027]|uniref:hypothetical protein n=1 Tax=unclassified Amycolatopsis TaxID=2618356 RepID=UPI0036702945
MTDETRGIGGIVGPPWSVDVLADLHAGALDEQTSADLWPRVHADPDARAIIDALESTQSDLAALATAPVEPMPAEYAARIDAALAAESSARQAAQGPRQFPGQAQREQAPPVPGQAPQAGPGLAPVVDLAAARKRRNKRIGWGAGIVTVAAAAVAAIAIIVPATQQSGGPTGGIAQPAPSGPAGPAGPTLGGDGSGAQSLLGKSLGVRDFGPLQTEERLDACVAANGLDPAVRPVGVQPVTVEGKAGVMVVYTTGKLAQYRMVAFGADCGPGNPAKLFDKVVGEK